MLNKPSHGNILKMSEVYWDTIQTVRICPNSKPKSTEIFFHETHSATQTAIFEIKHSNMLKPKVKIIWYFHTKEIL